MVKIEDKLDTNPLKIDQCPKRQTGNEHGLFSTLVSIQQESVNGSIWS